MWAVHSVWEVTTHPSWPPSESWPYPEYTEGSQEGVTDQKQVSTGREIAKFGGKWEFFIILPNPM